MRRTTPRSSATSRRARELRGAAASAPWRYRMHRGSGAWRAAAADIRCRRRPAAPVARSTATCVIASKQSGAKLASKAHSTFDSAHRAGGDAPVTRRRVVHGIGKARRRDFARRRRPAPGRFRGRSGRRRRRRRTRWRVAQDPHRRWQSLRAPPPAPASRPARAPPLGRRQHGGHRQHRGRGPVWRCAATERRRPRGQLVKARPEHADAADVGRQASSGTAKNQAAVRAAEAE